MKRTLAVKIFGILAIIALLFSALAPVFYAFAPQYIPGETTSDTVDVPVESVTTE